VADLVLHRDFVPDYDRAVAVAPGVRRVTARNPGPFTFTGTNTYIVGSGRVAVIDPGPDDASHLAALVAAVAGEVVTHILLTHSHRDHSGGARALADRLGVPVSAAVRRAALPASGPALDAESNAAFAPDVVLADGAVIAGAGWRLEAVATPGHASDHLAFALAGSDLVFSGDHVMAWSSTVVAPPDGSMAAYMASLDRLLARREDTCLPGHGGVLHDAHGFVAALKVHRREREATILARLAAGDRTIPAIVASVYAGLDPRLAAGAGMSVLAHLEDLVARGVVATDGPPAPAGVYRLTGRSSS
jgi:glyoxylase-like metal-dependent hydrolase (beta-lactamase superfamily II)